MRIRLGHVLALLCLMLVLPAMAQAAPSTVTVPEGCKVMDVKYGDDETMATLKPEEQVAFLFVYAMYGLEGDCLDKDNGIGRMVTLGELVKGVKASTGFVIGLSTNPVKDTNYSYDIIIIGKDCLIRATPRVKGIGALAIIGSATRSANFYYNPNGPDLTKAVKLTEYGYEGHGFRRQG
jgi:hypothetical protein